jgi:hypothetical protein
MRDSIIHTKEHNKKKRSDFGWILNGGSVANKGLKLPDLYV